MFLSRPSVGFFKKRVMYSSLLSCNQAGLTLHRLISNCSKELCSKPLVMWLEELIWKSMRMKQKFPSCFYCFPQAGTLESSLSIMKSGKDCSSPVTIIDYQYEWVGTAKKFHKPQNKLRLSVPTKDLEKYCPRKRVWGAFVLWCVFFLCLCFDSRCAGRGLALHTSLHVYLHASVSCYAKQKKLQFCWCYPSDVFDILGSMPRHGTVISSLPPGMANILYWVETF